MGTIEHFVEYAQAVQENFRILAPGGSAIVGVPNKLDPFLRPLIVHAMNGLGLYGYGMEKSFTPGELGVFWNRQASRSPARRRSSSSRGGSACSILASHEALRLAGLVGFPVRLFAWLYCTCRRSAAQLPDRLREPRPA